LTEMIPVSLEGIIALSLMIIMIFLSIPVAFCMIGASILVYLVFANIPLGVVAQNMFFNIQSYAYSAVPYFIIAGNIMARGVSAKKLLDLADSFVGFMPSGLAMAAVVGCALFGAISGSTVATVVALGGFMIPALLEKGYPKGPGEDKGANQCRAPKPLLTQPCRQSLRCQPAA